MLTVWNITLIALMILSLAGVWMRRKDSRTKANWIITFSVFALIFLAVLALKTMIIVLLLLSIGRAWLQRDNHQKVLYWLRTFFTLLFILLAIIGFEKGREIGKVESGIASAFFFSLFALICATRPLTMTYHVIPRESKNPK